MIVGNGTRRVVAEVVGGAIAGAVATWAMGKVTTLLYEREAASVRRAEDTARGGKTAYGVAAQKVARAVGTRLSVKERKRYGTRIHWALGASAGAAYRLIRDRLPGGLTRGLLFGTAFWLLADEGAVYVLGLTPGPQHFPWQTHARGLAGHLVYGAVADATLAGLEALPVGSEY
jgi:hypothetical protein